MSHKWTELLLRGGGLGAGVVGVCLESSLGVRGPLVGLSFAAGMAFMYGTLLRWVREDAEASAGPKGGRSW